MSTAPPRHCRRHHTPTATTVAAWRGHPLPTSVHYLSQCTLCTLTQAVRAHALAMVRTKARIYVRDAAFLYGRCAQCAQAVQYSSLAWLNGVRWQQYRYCSTLGFEELDWYIVLWHCITVRQWRDGLVGIWRHHARRHRLVDRQRCTDLLKGFQ